MMARQRENSTAANTVLAEGNASFWTETLQALSGVEAGGLDVSGVQQPQLRGQVALQQAARSETDRLKLSVTGCYRYTC